MKRELLDELKACSELKLPSHFKNWLSLYRYLERNSTSQEKSEILNDVGAYVDLSYDLTPEEHNEAFLNETFVLYKQFPLIIIKQKALNEIVDEYPSKDDIYFIKKMFFTYINGSGTSKYSSIFDKLMDISK